MNPPDEPTPLRSRSRLPRFGLRSLFVFAIVFCLLMGWVGRNFVRMREEAAAIETLKQAGATIYIKSGNEWQHHPATPHAHAPPNWNGIPSMPMRVLGLSGPAPIRSVSLGGDDPQDETLRRALATLASFPQLESVDLFGPAVTDESLHALSNLPNLPNLETLALARTSVTAAGLAGIPAPERIRYLSLFRQESPADLIAATPALTELRWVQLVDMPVSRESLAVIASLPKLETLRLIAIRPTEPDAFAPLAQAKNLKELVSRSSFGDDDVATIASLPLLEIVSVDGIGDAGLAKLESLTNLRRLYLQEPVTPDAARAFSAAHERCVVAYWTSEGGQYYQAGEKIEPPSNSAGN